MRSCLPTISCSRSLLTIALAGFLLLTASAETVAAFAQADVAHSTLKGKVTDQFNAAVSWAVSNLTSSPGRTPLAFAHPYERKNASSSEWPT